MLFAPRHIAIWNARRGFTLMELVIVMAILMALISITIPTMKNMNRKNKLRSTARELVALMKYARAEAIFGERMTEVFLDVEKRQYWLDLRTPDEKTGEYKPGGKKTHMEAKRDLNKEVWFDEVTSYDTNIIKDKIIAIDFYPDGSASPTLFTLTNDKADKLTVEVLKATGQTEITPGTIEEKKLKEEEERQEVLGEVAAGGTL